LFSARAYASSEKLNNPERTPVVIPAELSRDLKALDPDGELELFLTDLGRSGRGGRYQRRKALDGHTIYSITLNRRFLGDPALINEIALHELAHAVRDANGERDRLAKTWENRLGKFLGGAVASIMEEFFTVSVVAHAREKGLDSLLRNVLPGSYQAEQAAAKKGAPDAAAISGTARSLIQELNEIAQRPIILARLRQNRKKLFGQLAIDAAA
jgi:hypothetical protein